MNILYWILNLIFYFHLNNNRTFYFYRVINNSNSYLLSTAYLPPVSYFARLIHNGTAIIEQYETYAKQSYRNRANICTEKGKTVLSIPVTKLDGNHTITRDVVLNNSEKWWRNHWRAIQSAYSSSPYFLYYADTLSPFFQHPEGSLIRFNMDLVSKLCELIAIDTDMILSEHYEANPGKIPDFRNEIHPKKPVENSFFPEYKQVFSDRHGFIADLSIVDVLFNLGPETNSYLNKVASCL